MSVSPAKTTDMYVLARERIAALRLQAAAYYQQAISEPEVRFCLKGKVAGELSVTRRRQRVVSYVIRINQLLLEQHLPYFISDILPHEVAHLVVDVLYGPRVRPHGQQWAEVMQGCFGVEPRIYHALPTVPARRSLAQYPYRCGCREHQLTVIRHRRAMRGVVYLCNHCKGPLVLASDHVI